MSHKRIVAGPIKTASAKHRNTHNRITKRRAADTVALSTSRTDSQDQNTTSSLSVIACEYCLSHSKQWPQEQPVARTKADDVEDHGTKYQAGDMVKVRVWSKGRQSRLERAVIAEPGRSFVLVAWLFETAKDTARKQLLNGAVDSSQKFILSSHTDVVSVDTLTQLTYIAELHDGCPMGHLIEKVKAMEPSERPAAASRAPNSTISQQEPNFPRVPEQKGNVKQAKLQNKLTREFASGSSSKTLELKKQHKENKEAEVGKRARNNARLVEGGKKMVQKDIEVTQRRRNVGARRSSLKIHNTRGSHTNASEVSTPVENVTVRDLGGKSAAISFSSSPVARHIALPPDQLQSRNTSNKKHSCSSSGSRSQGTGKRRKLDAPPSIVSQDPPGGELSFNATFTEQSPAQIDEDVVHGEGRRVSFSHRAVITTALKRNDFEEYARVAGLAVKDIHTLIPNDEHGRLPCLNDAIIDEFIAMLVKEACVKDGYTEADKDSNKARPYVAFNCHWWNRDLGKVLSSNRKLGLDRTRLLSVKHVFMPVCDEDHWRLLVVSGQERTIQYFDSHNGPPKKFVEKALWWVEMTLHDAYNESDWEIVGKQLSPQQNNTVDCGVAVLLNAWAIATALPVYASLYSFKREVMLPVRYELAASLLSRAIDLEALPSVIKRMNGSKGIDEIPTNKIENTTDAAKMIRKQNPEKKGNTSYGHNNGSHGDQTHTADDGGEGDDHPSPISLCENEDQSKYKYAEGTVITAAADTERFTMTPGAQSEEIPPLSKVPLPRTGNRPQSFGPFAKDADQNDTFDWESQDGGVDPDPTLSLDRPTPSNCESSAANAAKSECQRRETSSFDYRAADTKMGNIEIKVEAGSSVSQGSTDTRVPRNASAPDSHTGAAPTRARPTQLFQRHASQRINYVRKSRNLSHDHNRHPSRLTRIDPADIPFKNDDSGSSDDSTKQRSIIRSGIKVTSTESHKMKNPFDGPDTRPPTPLIPRNDVNSPPPRAASKRKGVNVLGMSRPAGMDDLWSVEEQDWKRMNDAEKRRNWHVYRIMTAGFGQRSAEPCERCEARRKEGSKKLKTAKMQKLEECWVYNDGLGQQQQCAACRYSRNACSFVKYPQQASSSKTPCKEAQLTIGYGRKIDNAPLASEPRPSLWDTVVWVTFPDNFPFYDSSALAIYNCPKDLKKLGHDTWWEHAPQSGLGDSAVWKEQGEGGTWVHQGLATMLAVQHSDKFGKSLTVRLHEWDWLMSQLQKNRNDNLLSTCSDSGGQPQSTVIFIHATTQKPADVQHVYEDIRMLRLISGAKFRVYPNLREWQQDQEKLGDIRTLDEIAKSSSRPEYSYRPKTCFGGRCQFQRQERTVLKRSHSEGGRHVEVLKKGVHDRLTCISDQSQKTKKFRSEDQEERTAFGVQPHWFHQEYVPALSRGEFRVFISTSEADGEASTNARTGKIIAIAWTSRNSKKELHVVNADENHFGGSTNSKCGTLKQSDLKDFCLYVFEKLRDRNSPCYESLEVGVRLDVGVADDQGQKRFFVNEISRWYNAHYFPYSILAKPYTKICKAFAEVFGSYVHGRMPDMTDYR